MVLTANWTSPPLRGWVQVLPASSSIAGRSIPRAGGALNRWPTTVKRNRAHTAPEEETSLVITSPHESGERIVTRTVRQVYRPSARVVENASSAGGGGGRSPLRR